MVKSSWWRSFKPLIADYILVYKGNQTAVVEAKSDELGWQKV
jgi:type I site-specific restriction endonuclease